MKIHFSPLPSLPSFFLSYPWNSLGLNTGVGSLSLLQGTSQPRYWMQVSHTAGGFFTSWATREAQEYWSGSLSLLQQIFPTQELNQGLLHCKRILYQLYCQGSPLLLFCDSKFIFFLLPSFFLSSFYSLHFFLFSLLSLYLLPLINNARVSITLYICLPTGINFSRYIHSKFKMFCKLYFSESLWFYK